MQSAVQSKEQVIRDVYAAFNRRDTEAVLRSMRQDVDWPNGMEGGRVMGHDAIRSYWTRQWILLDPRVTPTTIREEPDGRVAVGVHQVVHDREGKLLSDQQIQHVYTFAGGLISHMEIRDAGPMTGGAVGSATGAAKT